MPDVFTVFLNKHDDDDDGGGNNHPCNKTLPPILIPFGENSIVFKLTQVNFLASLSFNKLQQLTFFTLTISQIYYELH